MLQQEKDMNLYSFNKVSWCRVPIWNAAIKYIEKSPIIGYGIIDSNEFVRASGIPGGTHAHKYVDMVVNVIK